MKNLALFPPELIQIICQSTIEPIIHDHIIAVLQATCRRLRRITLAIPIQSWQRSDRLLTWFRYSQSIDISTLHLGKSFSLNRSELYPLLAAIGDLKGMTQANNLEPSVDVNGWMTVNKRRRHAKLAKIDHWTWTEAVCEAAAANGHLSCLQYARTNSCPWNEQTLNAAISNGHLDCVRFCDSHGLSSVKACELAAENGQLAVLQYLIESGYNIGCSRTAAARNGHLDCLQYLIQKFGVDSLENIANTAALNGHLDCLQFAHKSGYSFVGTAYAAATGGNVDCLRFAHQSGSKLNRSCQIAAQRGHLECLRYAHQNGAKWKDAITHAAAFGHLDCLIYAHQNGDQWNSGTLHHAVSSGHWRCVAYMKRNGCPGDYTKYLKYLQKYLQTHSF